MRGADLEWTYDFPDADALWGLLVGPSMLGRWLDLLDPTVLEQVRVELLRALAEWRQADGSYRIPETCRIYTGERPAT